MIELEAVGKRYQKLEEQAMLLRALLPFKPPARSELWALRDIDLEVAEGETVGVMGRNGAGKTTLLRLLAGVTRPTVGRVRVQGRIGPLIGLGVGFAPEMSGRENVLVNGMLLGLSAREVRQRFDDIVAFSELESFIDTPVKFYSSGMTLRLGFSVIAHIDPTILLVDEILAVGDARFALRCFERLRTLQRDGATIVLVSHSMQMIRQICKRAVLIRGGRIEYNGEIENAIALHERSLVRKSSSASESIVEFLDARFLASGRQAVQVAYDDPVEVELRVRFHQRVDDPVFTLGVITNGGLFGGFNTTRTGPGWRTFHPGQETAIRLSFPARLAGGAYRLLVDVKDQTGDDRLALNDELILTVAERPESAGIVDLCADIQLGEGQIRTLEQA